jgi:hypothetical protein
MKYETKIEVTISNEMFSGTIKLGGKDLEEAVRTAVEKRGQELLIATLQPTVNAQLAVNTPSEVTATSPEQ